MNQMMEKFLNYQNLEKILQTDINFLKFLSIKNQVLQKNDPILKNVSKMIVFFSDVSKNGKFSKRRQYE